jgi:nucleotide-binding universal stress UspA family protein
MVLIQILKLNSAQILLKSASKLSIQLKKSLAVFYLVDKDEDIVLKETELKEFLKVQKLSDIQFTVRNSKTNTITSVCEELDASFLFIQIPALQDKKLRFFLNECRELRIPYLFYKDSFASLDMTKVIVPVGFLEEEIEKAQFASAFGRFCNSDIKILLANDYGSKAKTTAEKMKLLFDKFQLNYTQEKASKDSFKVEIESIQIAEKEKAGMIIISASRDYGLDDILFGPKEYHVIRKSPVPVLMVNPRGDLYALCD